MRRFCVNVTLISFCLFLYFVMVNLLFFILVNTNYSINSNFALPLAAFSEFSNSENMKSVNISASFNRFDDSSGDEMRAVGIMLFMMFLSVIIILPILLLLVYVCVITRIRFFLEFSSSCTSASFDGLTSFEALRLAEALPGSHLKALVA